MISRECRDAALLRAPAEMLVKVSNHHPAPDRGEKAAKAHRQALMKALAGMTL